MVVDAGLEIDIDAYAESTGREIEEREGAECLGATRIAGLREASFELTSSVESSKLEANARRVSSNSLLFRAGSACILTSNNLSFSKCELCGFSYRCSRSLNFLFSIVRSSMTLLKSPTLLPLVGESTMPGIRFWSWTW